MRARLGLIPSTFLALLPLLILVNCSGGGSETPHVPPAPPVVGSLTVFPSTASIEVGQTQQYTVVVKDTHGNIMKGLTVVWTTSDATVASINPEGVLTALRAGSTTVTATHAGVRSQLVTMSVTAAPVPPPVSRAPLPPWLTYCDDGVCGSLAPVVAALCPGSIFEPCAPSRETRIVPQVNGIPISGIFLLPRFETFPASYSFRLLGGEGEVDSAVVAYTAPSLVLRSDLPVLISSYDLPPVWGGTTILNFETQQLTSASLTTVFYRQSSFDTGSAAVDLHTQAQTIIQIEREMTGITSAEPVTAYFLPFELAKANRRRVGNLSFGNGTITVDYGAPRFQEIQGQSLARFSHEYAHELFDEISAAFGWNPLCLNEGLADAIGFLSGFLPERDFGPIGLGGLDFGVDRCLPQTDVHDVGNCYLWHLKQAGLLTPATVHGLFHPQHTYSFDSCTMNTHTGNILLVYFTEATGGADLAPVVSAMGLSHAGSYTAAKTALALP